MPELDPCPFCGGTAVLDGSASCFWVRCTECKAETRATNPKAAAIALWNKRVGDGPEKLRPKGHWNIRSSRDLFPDERLGDRFELFFLECSECRRKVVEGVDQDAARNGEYRKVVVRFPYCHCGCKMEE